MFQFKSIRTKLMVGCLMLSIIPIGIISFYLYQTSSKTINRNTSEALVVGLNGYAEQLDDMFMELYYEAVKFTFDDVLRSYIREKKGDAIQRYLKQYNKKNPLIDSVEIDIHNGKYRVCSDQGIDKEAFDNYGTLYGTAKNNYSIHILNRYDPIRQKNYFTLRKNIYDPKADEIMATLIINIEEKTLYYENLDPMTKAYDGKIFLVNEDKYLVASKESEEIGTYINEEKEMDFITTSKGFFTETIRGEKILNVFVVSEVTKYKLVYQLPQTRVLGNIQRVKYLSFILTFMVFILTIILWYFFTHDIYYPIKRIKEAMEQMGEGQLKAHIDHERVDEVGTLMTGFNDMSERVNDLFNQVYHTKYLKKEAELRALQSQITPHFLYNTLNSIKCIAVINGCDVISKMLGALIDLLRATAGNKETFIPLSHEINQVQNYVELQQFRYNNAFKVRCKMDPCYEEVLVPKLIIQPLVENAIQHGLDLRGEDGIIDISIKEEASVDGSEESRLIIEVQDNGRGISKEAIQRILSNQEDKRNKFSGIGVYNVDERIKLYYGHRYGLCYKSLEGSGTRATITLPLRRKDEIKEAS